MAKDLAEFLEELGLERFRDVFAANDVDLDILPELSDDDLKELGLSLGARRRLQRALDHLSATPGPCVDTPSSDSAAPDRAAPDRAAPDRAAPDRAAPDSATPDAERRQLTLLFCDLVGSTALSTRIDAEDLRRVLQDFQDTCAQEVERFGGYVAKYMGDGALAYFGYPDAHEDDAERAINAGLSFVEAMTQKDWGIVDCPGVRVGIATGFVVVGDLIGRDAAQEAAVVGETPNIAARLEGLAEPNTVVIDAATKELAGGLFVLDDLGEHSLKGFDRPHQVWAVVERGKTESRFSAVRGQTVTELVGRDEELELLLRRWQRAQEGEGQLVLVSGEPGIGKSRLVHALGERTHEDPHTRLRYQCSPFHTNSALHPIIEQLERAAGFESSDSRASRLDKLERTIAAVGRPVEQDAPILATLLSLSSEDRYPPISVTPQRLKQLVIETLEAQLAGLAGKQPVLFIFEDAHWIDPTTQELLNLTAERLSNLPVLMQIVTHRPSYVPSWSGRSNVTQLSLSGLGRQESALLAAEVSRSRDLPAEVLQQIVAKTDGVPLFIEEFTRAALESQSSGEAIAIPATLKDALEARMGGLEHGNEVVQIGAAIGRTFDYRLLAAVCRESVPLDRSLEELVDAQLVFVRGDPPEATYTFKHALVQDTAYDSLLRDRRREIHTRIAQVLERDYPNLTAEEPELLAHHLTEADRVEGAIPYWQRAGEIAARRFAMREAIHHWTKAIELVWSLPKCDATRSQELDLLLRLAPAYQSTQGFGSLDAGRTYEQAGELAKTIGDPDRTFTAKWGRWMVNQMRPKKGVAQRLTPELHELSDRSGDRGQKLQACHASWSSLYFLAEFEETSRYAEEGIRLYDVEEHAQHRFMFGGHDPGTCARLFFGQAQLQLGALDTAISAAEDSVALAEQVEHPPSIAAHLGMSALLRTMRREPDHVHDLVERAISICEEHGIPHAMWGDIYRGWVIGQRGRPDEAIGVMLRTIGEPASLGNEAIRPYFLGLIAEMCGEAGRPDEGLQHLATAFEWGEEHEILWVMSPLHRIRGELRLQLGAPEPEIESCWRHALEIARGQTARLWELGAAFSLARWWADRGKPDEAREVLTPAYQFFTEGLDSPVLREARALFERLG